MKCHDLRHHIANLESPQRPPADCRGHLVSCAACRTWYRHLLRVERQVPRLPVPAAQRKNAFMDLILSGEVSVGQPAVVPFWRSLGRSGGPPDRSRAQQKLALATALAAGLLVLAASFSVLQWKPPPVVPTHPAVDPLTEKFLTPHRDHLAPTVPVPQRIATLKNVLDTVHQESQALARASNSDDLNALATWYERVLKEQLLEQARAVPEPQRPAILGDLASQLDRISAETQKVAEEEVSGDAARQLLKIVAVSHDLSQKLRATI
jgi:hypothetical protein